MTQLRHHADQLAAAGIQPIIITFERPELAAQYARQTQLPWPILPDTQQTLYQAYGMHQASWSQLLSPATWGTYLRLMVRGRMPHRPTGDVHQLGGDVLVDPQGIVRHVHISQDPADRPSIPGLLARAAARSPKEA